MKLIDWIAIIGALAWTPHLISIIKKYITKPEVRIISNRSGELGFTTFGPIFNVRLAFSVKNHDIVVSGLKVRIIHENGEEKVFEWQGIKQQVLKMTAPDGSVMPYEKENSVLAIKLNQKEIEERSIQCRETAFINGKDEYETKAIKRMTYLKDQGEFEKEEFRKSQEMTDLYGYIKHSFSWKSGVYKAVIELESPESFDLVDNEYEFTLTPIDIEELDKNKSQIEIDYGRNTQGNGNQEKLNAVWNWRNPILKKLNK